MSDQYLHSSDVLQGWEDAYECCDGETMWRSEPIACMPHLIHAAKAANLHTAIDLGCGDGRNLLALLEAGFTCGGIDSSKTALSRAHQKISAHGYHALLLQGDIIQLPLADHSVEIVTCFDVFGQLTAPQEVIAEARRVLIPGGLLALNAFTTGDSEFGVGERIGLRTFLYKRTLFHYFEAEELHEMLAGWSILRFDKTAWVDPPHGDFRPYSHRHENWVVFANSPASV